MKQYTLISKVDTNDADYVTEIFTINEQQLTRLLSILQIIQNTKLPPYTNNWDQKTRKNLYPNLSEDDIEVLDGYLPGVEYMHSIESIQIGPEIELETVFRNCN